MRLHFWKQNRFLCQAGLGLVSIVLFGHNLASAEEVKFNAEQVGFFEEKIRPVLVAKCYKCHSDRSVKLKGGLHVDSREGLLKGGDSGDPALVPGKPGEGLFLIALRHEEEDLAMPPKEKLSAGVIEDFEKWIKMGVPFPAPKENTEEKEVADQPDWWDTVDPKKLLPKEKSIQEVVDHYVDARLKKEKIQPVETVSEETLIRRLTLDLAGRIPTIPETEAFLASKDENKVEKVVDQLIASDSFSRHFVNEFDWYLMGDRGGMRKYLEQAFQEKKTWDQMFKDIILAKGDKEDATKKELAKFLKERVKQQDKLTNDVSVAFFGINVSCAQCHDHPEVPSWKQDHYYGMKSFFNRMIENGDYLGEEEYGLVKFKTTKGVEKTAKLMFLDGKAIDEPENKEPTKEEKEKLKKERGQLAKDKKPLPDPNFSRRAKLVEAALKDDAGFFSRAIVNRIWYRYFGKGLVAPIDQLHGANLPSHPELLVWLARDFKENGYDLRRLIKGLVLSETYARSGVWPEAKGDRPVHSLFAVREARALTPEQMGSSLIVAATDPHSFDLSKEEEYKKRIEGLENSGRGWNRYFPRPNDLFAVDVSEALFFSNNDRVSRDLVSTNGGKLAYRLLQEEDPNKQVEIAFRSTLSRPPSEQEQKLFTQYLTERKDRIKDACSQIVWALMTSAEFRFNH